MLEKNVGWSCVKVIVMNLHATLLGWKIDIFFYILMLCSCITLVGELQTGVRRLIINQSYYY